MHHERGQAMVGLELPALGQLAVGVVLREVGRDVPARGSQQIAVLVGELEGWWRIGEHDEAEQRVVLQDRQHQSKAILALQELRQARGSDRNRVRVDTRSRSMTHCVRRRNATISSSAATGG